MFWRNPQFSRWKSVKYYLYNWYARRVKKYPRDFLWFFCKQPCGYCGKPTHCYSSTWNSPLHRACAGKANQARHREVVAQIRGTAQQRSRVNAFDQFDAFGDSEIDVEGVDLITGGGAYDADEGDGCPPGV